LPGNLSATRRTPAWRPRLASALHSWSDMRRCPNCGEENPARARFCLACGEALAEPAVQSEERKVVTVLFCDLVGFTARSDRADPEDVRAALRPYHSLLRKEIERFGGTLEKFIGDAVMAVFGAPVAHEDDAERAVRAALRITEAIGELNQEHEGLELAVRVGINTGEAVVALGTRPEQGEGIVTGDVVNTASRLQGVAPVGGVVVGEPTFRATREIFDYEALEAVQVKGKAQPLPIWLARSARSRFGVDVDQDKPTPFIGRDDDLSLLNQTYARALRDSSIQLVTVTGEPGVGKTRLLAEFRAFVDDQPELVYWRQGRCLPYGEGITFWALGEIVKAHCGLLDTDDATEASQKLEETITGLVEDDADRDWIRTRMAPLVGVRAPDGGGTAGQEEAFTAWRRFLEAVAAFRPLVVVFEDLHWADEAMLAFIEHLVDWSNVVPLLVVCTARPELYERHPGWGGGKRNSTTVSLAPLTEEDTARLISALLSQAVLPAETQRALLERSGGNPLYAEEFVKMLTDRGILTRKGRSWTVAEGAEIPVPDNVQALIAARLDTLPADRKTLLQDASVVGKVFWTGAVSTMGGVEEPVVRAALHDLARNELVRPARRSSVKDQDEYSFWHLLVRDVAYSQIPRAARARKHRAAAAWIEGIAAERLADHAELLAYHYLQALELSRAAGADGEAEGLVDGARRFLILAGDRAAQLDMAKAEAYYAQALEMTPSGHPERGRLLLKKAEAAWLTGRANFDEADALFVDATEQLRSAGDILGAGDAMTKRSGPMWGRGDTARSRRIVLDAIELLEPLGPSAELAAAYATLTGRVTIAGESREALEWAEKTLSMARAVGAEHVAARTLQFRGMARLIEGDPEGFADLEESLRRSIEFGLANAASVAYTNLADWTTESEGFARSIEIYDQGIEFSTRRGLRGNARWARMERTFRLYDLGRWDELLREEDEIVALDRGTPDGEGGQITVQALTYKALVLAMRGQTEEAVALMEEFLPRARAIADIQPLWLGLNSAAQIELLRGNPAAALVLVREVAPATEATAATPYLVAEVARFLVAGGDVDGAAAFLDRVSSALPRWELAKRTGEATVLEARGTYDDALALYQPLAEEWGSFGSVLERAYALFGAGRCLLSLGRANEATTQLTAAREIFVSLGARPLIDEIDGHLAEATALTS
jgi:class 3 adenylate cyclase/tetratricopeptide (TPR) repeat protein